MDPLLAIPATDPLEIYRARDGLCGVDLLAAGVVHLDFFSWLSGHPSTLGGICAHFGIQVRPADVMLTLFSAMGLVTQSGGCFHVTLRAREHLVAGSPWSLVPYYASLRDRPQTLDMLKVLRTGKPANWGSYDPQAWAEAMERPEFALQFTAAMDCRGVYLGRALSGKLDLGGARRLLDIAGGSGVYACSLTAYHPQLRAAVFEKPPVDRIARDSVERRGASERVEVIAGDLFEGELPGGFDVHLLSNVLHDWDEPVVRGILLKSARALTPGGCLVVHDCHLNAQKTGPLPVANYSALLMQLTEGRCYSVSEIRLWMQDAGLEFVRHEATAADRSYILARRV